MKKNRKLRRPKKATIEDVGDGEQENIERQLGVAKPKKVKKPKPEKIFETLRTAAAYLKDIGTTEDVEEWLLDKGFLEDDQLKELRDICVTISSLLRCKTRKQKAGISEATKNAEAND